MEGSENSRIAKNTAVIYVRMAVTIVVGLVTSRLVLQALGASDVGIYSAVGSTVALVSFITGALTATTVRFMNFEMGKPGGDTNRMFNICHVIHIGGALVLLLLLESVGLWYIHTHLNVPPGKEDEAMFVFQVSTLVACLGIANVPFQSLFNVHERFATVAVVDIVNALVKLGLVGSLFAWNGDGLRLYAVLMSVTTWISFAAYHLLSRRRWPSIVRWKPVRDPVAYREVLVFNNYNLLSSASLIVRSQGSNMLINFFFGTTVNAAYYYAGTVQNYVNQFIANFDTAAAPQITRNISAGNPERSLRLTETTCRICILLLLLLLFPLWSELDLILHLWLGAKMPEGTVLMCRWTLLIAAVSSTSAGIAQLINAYGRVKWYKIQFAVLYLASLAVGWLLFRSGHPAYTIIIAFVAADALSRINQLILLRIQFRFPLGRFLRHAYLRPLAVAAVMVLYLFLYKLLPLESTGMQLVGLAVTLAVTAAAILLIGLRPSERKRIRKFLYRKWHAWELDHCYAQAVQRDWKKRFGHRIDWDHPQDLNEKIQWLLYRSDTTQWARLADKVRVRDYVTEKGHGDLLVPLLGTWKRSADIPYERLPERFVLKCNHDSASTRIIGPGTDRTAVGEGLDAALKVKYGYRLGELYYNDITPCILAEEYLDSGTEVPVDYKVWCFGGRPWCIWACEGRTADHVDVNIYDLDWNVRPEVSVGTAHYRVGNGRLPRPVTPERMLQAAADLSAGFPEVRVDFYEVRGRLYFGEMTFAGSAGRMDYFTPEFLREMGDQVTLPR